VCAFTVVSATTGASESAVSTQRPPAVIVLSLLTAASPKMGTAAGFFGITYQGAVNGLASVTLSIFNMDHPDDRAWLKYVYDYTVPDGLLPRAKVPELLDNFYRRRPEGPTQSGSYLTSHPSNELEFVNSLYEGGAETIDFPCLIEALMAAQADFAEPAAPLEYGSALVLRNDRVKHTRNVLDPQQQFRKPMTTSQEVGWELLSEIRDDVAKPQGTPFHLRTSATTQFADAMEKQTWGRSIGGEFSAYATRKLNEFGGLGMGV